MPTTTTTPPTNALAPQPVAANYDLQLLIQPDGAGGLQVELGQAPGGDLGAVTGKARLVQRVNIWFMAVQGSNPFQPHAGNPSYRLIGVVTDGNSLDLYQTMVEQCLSFFLADQQNEIILGVLSAAETITNFTNISPSRDPRNPAKVTVSFTIVTADGGTTPYATGFTFTGS